MTYGPSGTVTSPGPIGQTNLGQATSLTEGLVRPLWAPPPGGYGTPSMSMTGCLDYSPSGTFIMPDIFIISQLTRCGVVASVGDGAREDRADPVMVNPPLSPGVADAQSVTEPTRPQLRAAAATFSLLGSEARLHLAWLMAMADSMSAPLPSASGSASPPPAST